jgi:hypothetical protein
MSLRAARAWNPANVSITGGTISGVAGVRLNLLSNGIPFIFASSGSMGNNGAVSGLTALDTTYSDGAYIYLPAAAIVAGGAAGWYWFVGSSTTAGTVYNSMYTSGVPVAGTLTAFVTTGPGAFTGATAAVDSIVISVPAGLLGTQGYLAYEINTDTTNNANGKTVTARLATTDFAAFPVASSLSWHGAGNIQNRGAANRQVGSTQSTHGGWGVAGAVNTFRGSVDTASAQNFVLRVSKGTATDNLIISSLAVDAVSRP